MNRRDFLAATAASGTTLLLGGATDATATDARDFHQPVSLPQAPRHQIPDLSPAHWIWYPSGRTLPSTFVLFRRTVRLAEKPRRATGWICADSRYRLEVNGKRVQWGPAPADPRWAEADPVDLVEFLEPGENVLAATVLFYGSGDGTSPLGKPGFLFWLEIEDADGGIERVVSDDSWHTLMCRAWRPGRPKRWYLRALQEEFDARLYPDGWSRPGFEAGPPWLKAMNLDGSPNKPALSTDYYQYMLDPDSGPSDAELRPRSILLMQESMVPIAKLSECHSIKWQVDPHDYFDFRGPDAYLATPAAVPVETGAGEWLVEMDGESALALTFEFAEQIVGWPAFTVEAPAGTEIELLVHEAHGPDGPALLNTHFDSWTRFICREGINNFETFDFESLRWLQLHIHAVNGKVRISHVRVRRRAYPWAHQPQIRSTDQQLQLLFDATANTLVNCAQETLVDGMARERQQYSGDGAHQIHALHLACGESRQVARYLTTWSQGMTKDGYFLDCWPAFDRLQRLTERQLDLTPWGPLLDHGVGFNFDCWHHYMYTGDLDALREPYPRLLRFAHYLQGLVRPDNLLPVENLGIPYVWIDHHAYTQQRHKQCAFNLYAAAAMEHALAGICDAFGDTAQAAFARQFSRQLRAATIRRFWSSSRGMFVNNLPWISEEGAPSTCDRSLATSIFFDQCPAASYAAALQSLVECPAEMGFSYPANSCWRYWALAKSGRADVFVSELHSRWLAMESVRPNKTLQEEWHVTPDSSQQWSHCAVVPLYMAFHGLMGLRAIEPGFTRFELRPQLADLPDLDLTAFTVQGPLRMKATGRPGARDVFFELPPRCEGELILPRNEDVNLPEVAIPEPRGNRRFKLPVGGSLSLHLRSV